jgi:hypothetical protein
VLALIRTPDPQRTLLSFTAVGFTVSVTIGLVLVLVLHGADVNLGGSTFTAVFDLIAGVAALAFAIGYRQGRISLRGATAPRLRLCRHPRGRDLGGAPGLPCIRSMVGWLSERLPWAIRP